MKRPTLKRLEREFKRLRAELAIAATNLQRFLKFHQIGQLVLSYNSGRCSYGEKTIDELSNVLGVSAFGIYQMRTFANTYTTIEVRQLLRAAPAVTLSHLPQLVSVRDRNLRQTFEIRLGKHGWSAGELQRAITAKIGPRRHGRLPTKRRSAMKAVRDAHDRIEVASRLLRAYRTTITGAVRRGQSNRVRGELLALAAAAAALGREANNF